MKFVHGKRRRRERTVIINRRSVHRTARRKICREVDFIGIKAMWIVMIGTVVDARDLMNVSAGIVTPYRDIDSLLLRMRLLTCLSFVWVLHYQIIAGVCSEIVYQKKLCTKRV